MIQELRDENDWKNGLALWVLPDSWVAAMPRVVRAWLRCYLMCMLLYVATGAAWAYYIYGVFRRQLFGGGPTPAASDMLEQIKVTLSACDSAALQLQPSCTPARHFPDSIQAPEGLPHICRTPTHCSAMQVVSSSQIIL